MWGTICVLSAPPKALGNVSALPGGIHREKDLDLTSEPSAEGERRRKDGGTNCLLHGGCPYGIFSRPLLAYVLGNRPTSSAAAIRTTLGAWEIGRFSELIKESNQAALDRARKPIGAIRWPN